MVWEAQSLHLLIIKIIKGDDIQNIWVPRNITIKCSMFNSGEQSSVCVIQEQGQEYIMVTASVSTSSPVLLCLVSGWALSSVLCHLSSGGRLWNGEQGWALLWLMQCRAGRWVLLRLGSQNASDGFFPSGCWGPFWRVLRSDLTLSRESVRGY